MKELDDDMRALADRLLMVEARLDELEDDRLAETCDACNGTGQYVDYPAASCPRCHSTESTTATETQSEVPESARLCTCGRVDLAAFDIGAGRTEAHSVDGILHIAHDSEHHGNRDCFAQLPEWRIPVDREVEAKRSDEAALKGVLWLLYRLVADYDTIGNLARIVRVCEAQVGDGWRANPEGIHHWHGAEPERVCDLECLLKALSDVNRWRLLGNRAAAWLRDLCNGVGE